DVGGAEAELTSRRLAGRPSSGGFDVSVEMMVGDEVELDAVLKKGLATCKGETEAAHGIDRSCDSFVITAREARRRDGDERGVLGLCGEDPFDRRWPLDQDPSIRFERLDSHDSGCSVHFPVPSHVPAFYERRATSREPKSTRDCGIDEGLEDFRYGPTNEHL